MLHSMKPLLIAGPCVIETQEVLNEERHLLGVVNHFSCML